MSQAQKPKKPVKKSFSGKQSTKKAPTKSQKLFRGPLFWIIAAIFAVTVFGQISSAGNSYTKIETSQALDAISKAQVESAELVDRDQKIRLILNPGTTIKGS